MNITVVGAGYVGLPLAVALSLNHKVKLLDIDYHKVNSVNLRHSPLKDDLLSRYMREFELDLTAMTDRETAYSDAELVFIAVPTDFDEHIGCLDVRNVLNTVADISRYAPKSVVCIKSTIPIGYTRQLSEMFPSMKIVFSPEFMREGHGMEDTLNPSRIIVGGPDEDYVPMVARNLCEIGTAPILLMDSDEAEAVKLFSNAHLATRVAFFNELDSFALENRLNARKIIDGVCLDPRVGNHYNNPSFGYGGYCLPKDTKQLLSQFPANVNYEVIEATVVSNDARKIYLASYIQELGASVVGIYRLTMKKDSDNFRESAVQGILNELKALGVACVIYEPGLKDTVLDGCGVIFDINTFKDMCDVIVANRMDDALLDVSDKVFTRDIYNEG